MFQHRRKRDGQRETEIQADFMFLSQRGELSVEETQGAIKILLLVECFSSCFGAVVVREPEETKRQIKKWLDHFGVKSRSTSVVIHTDAEVAVGNLVGRASGEGDYTFHVRRAGPQQHASIGRGERAVRALKESLSVLRADLNQQGLDLVFSSDVLETVLTYLSLMRNHFSKAHGTDSSPLELSVGRRLSKPVVSLFGSCVLGELPDSVKHLSPNETRNVEAAYLHCGLDRGSLVQAKVRCEGGLELIQFTARNLRPISPLSWKLDLCVGLLTKLEQTDMPQGYIHDQFGVSHDPQGSEPVEDMPFHSLPVSEQRRLKSESLGVEMRQLVPPVVKERPNKGPGVFMRREGVGSRVVDAGTSRSPQGSPNSDGRRVSPPRRASEGAGAELRFVPTRNCPSCASGVNVPGTRHTAHCKRRFAEFQEEVNKHRRFWKRFLKVSRVPRFLQPQQKLLQILQNLWKLVLRFHRLWCSRQGLLWSTDNGSRELRILPLRSWRRRCMSLVQFCRLIHVTQTLIGFGSEHMSQFWFLRCFNLKGSPVFILLQHQTCFQGV